MSSLGSYLSGHRQRRGFSLDEMARVTRVASHYLQALEADDHDALPAPVFTKGFIRAYCQVVGVVPNEALALYQQRGGGPVAVDVVESQGDLSEPKRGVDVKSRGAVLVSFVLLVVLGIALFAVTLALQTGREDPATRRGGSMPPDAPAEAPPVPTPPAPMAVPAPPAVAPPPLPAVPSTPTATPDVRPSVGEQPRAGAAPSIGVNELVASVGTAISPYRLVARVSEPTWMRVRMDDGRLTEETVPAGEVRQWVSNAPFILTVGNAGGVTLELNGQTLPPLGARGAVIPRLVIPPLPQ